MGEAEALAEVAEADLAEAPRAEVEQVEDGRIQGTTGSAFRSPKRP